MNKLPEFILGLFLTSLIRAQFAVAVTIPTTIQTSSQAESFAALSSTLLPATSSASKSVISTVAQRHPNTGHNYALDPFGFLQSTRQEGQETAGGDHQTGKQTSTSKATEATSNGATATASKSTSNANSSTATGRSSTETKPESSTSAKPETNAAQSSATQSNNAQFATTTHASPGAAPTQKGTDRKSDSSGSSMNSWKIIGIGIMSVAGVTLLVIGTAFHDAIFRALCRSYRRRKGGEEVLVPDWHRGSWRFGDDGYGLEKPSFNDQDEEGPRIPEGEKGNLAFPLPPVSPFPLRRTPSANSRPSEPGPAGVGAAVTDTMKAQGSSYSVLPSPPGLHTQEPLRRKSTCSSSESPHAGHESDAYGGIE
ncbi:hypothetical protein A7U60_g3834 [Sanghuangporus baumii]|uniref:Mucin-like protein n=1 Tax=Sanghuangporus baumii TaxID=108892 RepID=A0A9Q5N9T2_SANBA|nr:hypothetical protein A7U60_g3834 [Sanghuangporus baumii]